MELSVWMYVVIGNLTLFSELSAQTYDGSKKGHTTFPTDIPTDTKVIDLDDNNINSFPDDAFTKFYQLEKLQISRNPFTKLPHLRPVGNTLKVLRMLNCQLTELDPGIFNELVALKDIILNYCRLTIFPDVPGPGSTLSKLDCFSCKLTAFPMISNYKAMKYISFSDNPIATVAETAIAGVHLTGQLRLWGTAIASFPDYPMAYENITYLDLHNTAVSFSCSIIIS